MPSELSSTAAAIVTTARALLVTRGYNGFSYADIAETVGISKPSIHHHFPNKESLVRRVVADYRAEAQAGMAALRERLPDPVARLQAWTRFWQACLREGTLPFCVCALLATEMPAIPEEVASVLRGHFDDSSGWLADLLAEGARSGRFRLHGSASIEAASFVASIHGAMIAARAYRDPELFIAISDAQMARLTATH